MRMVIRQEGIGELIKKIFLYILLRVGFGFAAYVPHIKDEIVVFGSAQGQNYTGNSRYLYEYVLEHESGVEPIWMTKDSELFRKLRVENKPVAKSDSLRSVPRLIQAQAFLFTHSSLDVLPVHLYPISALNIHLGHGHPIKYNRKPGPVSKYEQKRDGVDYFIVESEFLRDVHRERYPATISEEQYLVTGYPRNDVLLDPPTAWHEEWENFLEDKQCEIDQVMLYAPTQRQPSEIEATDTIDIFPFRDFDIRTLERVLEETNSLLLLKLHPSDVRQMKESHYATRHDYEGLSAFLEKLSEHERVEYVSNDHQFSDPNRLLPFVDVLVTDYSSIYHDFLLLDRPILFIPYDYDEFESDFGFGYDYYENLPGPTAETFEEFLEQLNSAIKRQEVNSEQRRELRNKLHKFHNSGSCQRTWEAICGVPETIVKRGD